MYHLHKMYVSLEYDIFIHVCGSPSNILNDFNIRFNFQIMHNHVACIKVWQSLYSKQKCMLF